MKNDLIKVNLRTETVGIRTLKYKYIAEVSHSGLNDFKVFSDYNPYILNSKVDAHKAKLEEKWSYILNKQQIIKSKEESIKWAEERTVEALEALHKIETILINAVGTCKTFDWEQVKDKTKFAIGNPKNNLARQLEQIPKPNTPIYLSKPTEPNPKYFVPKFSFLEKLFKSKRKIKIDQTFALYNRSVESWKKSCENIDSANQKKKDDFQTSSIEYENQKEQIRKKNAEDVIEWERLKNEFYLKQDENNSKIDTLKKDYLASTPHAVIEYCELVLNNIETFETFSNSFEIDYNSETKILIIEYSLPPVEQFPTLNKIKYISNEFKEYHLTEIQTNKLFDTTMYNITLKVLYTLFKLDTANAIDAISFNGWIDAVNKATGKKLNSCILSIQVKKTEFKEIDLKHVDPKVCFKTLRGIGSSTLSGITPIQPILQINKTDKRFVNYYEVADSIDNSTNLASMDWQDFEHLIREVFAKEFSSNGGEVKVTQASRDGGVDAIAFDPDPIRGGKIVIQAKRYTNTVGVSSVRDLYGTVLNEGATKGILVTTTDYGPDAYEFIKGKPLTLMNGANLLYLLERHGHQAKIDIKEAKKINAEMQNNK